MKTLVTGGAGYIGSHMVKLLMKKGHQVTVLDDLSSGHRNAIPNACLITGSLGDERLLDELLQQPFDSVFHFASFIQVAESSRDPVKYYQNNVVNTLNLLNKMVTHGKNNLIFSSTAAIFGNPQYTPIDESHPKQPINPYGRSKLIIEQILADYDAAYGLKSACLRYFNACGADPEGALGECHDPETHLIPLILQAASGKREHIKIFGDDYDTKDGTCIRDYIHVSDLCQAHLLAMEKLFSESKSITLNLGNENGFSVKEVVDTAERITGVSINRKLEPRRAGDPPILIADSSRAHSQLGWQPKYTALETILQHAWNWELKQPLASPSQNQLP